MKKIFITMFLLVPSLSFAAFDTDLYVGMQHNPQVEELQTFLSNEGLYQYQVTGNYGGITQQAVRRFQSREGISPVSGYFGPLTRSVAKTLTSNVSVTPPVQDTVVYDKIQKIKDLLALIESLKKQLATLQAQPTPITQHMEPTQEQSNQTSGATAQATSTPVAQPEAPIVLVPKIEVVSQASQLSAGLTHQLILTLKISNLDENMVLQSVPFTVSGFDPLPTLGIEYKNHDVRYNSAILPKGQDAIINLYVDTPSAAGDISLTVSNWEISGQTSGDIRQVTGFPISLTVPVVVQ